MHVGPDTAHLVSDATECTVVLGTDIVDVLRFARMSELRGPSLAGLVFTPQELASCRGQPARLAARLAAKEAVAKALGTGIGTVGWRDVEVVSGESGAPAVLLGGNARDLARAQGLGPWAVSLSHDAGQAVAVVAAVRAPRAPAGSRGET